MSVIDLSFALDGGSIPLDHGYVLYAALSRLVLDLHGDVDVGVHPIRGRRIEPGVLALDAGSRLRIRVAAERIAPYIALAGCELDLDGRKLEVGMPKVEELTSAPNLASRLVTVRHAVTEEQITTVIRRDLEQMGVAATPELVPSPRRPGEAIRRVLAVKGRKIVGFAVRVNGLSAEESLKLQVSGIGGRRRFGAGLFTPYYI